MSSGPGRKRDEFGRPFFFPTDPDRLPSSPRSRSGEELLPALGCPTLPFRGPEQLDSRFAEKLIPPMAPERFAAIRDEVLRSEEEGSDDQESPEARWVGGGVHRDCSLVDELASYTEAPWLFLSNKSFQHMARRGPKWNDCADPAFLQRSFALLAPIRLDIKTRMLDQAQLFFLYCHLVAQYGESAHTFVKDTYTRMGLESKDTKLSESVRVDSASTRVEAMSEEMKRMWCVLNSIAPALPPNLAHHSAFNSLLLVRQSLMERLRSVSTISRVWCGTDMFSNVNAPRQDWIRTCANYLNELISPVQDTITQVETLTASEGRSGCGRDRVGGLDQIELQHRLEWYGRVLRHYETKHMGMGDEVVGRVASMSLSKGTSNLFNLEMYSRPIGDAQSPETETMEDDVGDDEVELRGSLADSIGCPCGLPIPGWCTCCIGDSDGSLTRDGTCYVNECCPGYCYGPQWLRAARGDCYYDDPRFRAGRLRVLDTVLDQSNAIPDSIRQSGERDTTSADAKGSSLMREVTKENERMAVASADMHGAFASTVASAFRALVFQHQRRFFAKDRDSRELEIKLEINRNSYLPPSLTAQHCAWFQQEFNVFMLESFKRMACLPETASIGTVASSTDVVESSGSRGPSRNGLAAVKEFAERILCMERMIKKTQNPTSGGQARQGQSHRNEPAGLVNHHPYLHFVQLWRSPVIRQMGRVGLVRPIWMWLIVLRLTLRNPVLTSPRSATDFFRLLHWLLSRVLLPMYTRVFLTLKEKLLLDLCLREAMQIAGVTLQQYSALFYCPKQSVVHGLLGKEHEMPSVCIEEPSEAPETLRKMMLCPLSTHPAVAAGRRKAKQLGDSLRGVNRAFGLGQMGGFAGEVPAVEGKGSGPLLVTQTIYDLPQEGEDAKEGIVEDDMKMGFIDEPSPVHDSGLPRITSVRLSRDRVKGVMGRFGCGEKWTLVGGFSALDCESKSDAAPRSESKSDAAPRSSKPKVQVYADGIRFCFSLFLLSCDWMRLREEEERLVKKLVVFGFQVRSHDVHVFRKKFFETWLPMYDDRVVMDGHFSADKDPKAEAEEAKAEEQQQQGDDEIRVDQEDAAFWKSVDDMWAGPLTSIKQPNAGELPLGSDMYSWRMVIRPKHVCPAIARELRQFVFKDAESYMLQQLYILRRKDYLAKEALEKRKEKEAKEKNIPKDKANYDLKPSSLIWQVDSRISDFLKDFYLQKEDALRSELMECLVFTEMNLSLYLEGTNLVKMDFFSKSDPVCVCLRRHVRSLASQEQNPNRKSRISVLGYTNFIKDDHNPKWKDPLSVSFVSFFAAARKEVPSEHAQTCDILEVELTNMVQSIAAFYNRQTANFNNVIIAVIDHDGKNKDWGKSLMGYVEVDLAELVQESGRHERPVSFPLTFQANADKAEKLRNKGSMLHIRAVNKNESSFSIQQDAVGSQIKLIARRLAIREDLNRLYPYAPSGFVRTAKDIQQLMNRFKMYCYRLFLMARDPDRPVVQVPSERAEAKDYGLVATFGELDNDASGDTSNLPEGYAKLCGALYPYFDVDKNPASLHFVPEPESLDDFKLEQPNLRASAGVVSPDDVKLEESNENRPPLPVSRSAAPDVPDIPYPDQVFTQMCMRLFLELDFACWYMFKCEKDPMKGGEDKRKKRAEQGWKGPSAMCPRLTLDNVKALEKELHDIYSVLRYDVFVVEHKLTYSASELKSWVLSELRNHFRQAESNIARNEARAAEEAKSGQTIQEQYPVLNWPTLFPRAVLRVGSNGGTRSTPWGGDCVAYSDVKADLFAKRGYRADIFSKSLRAVVPIWCDVKSFVTERGVVAKDSFVELEEEAMQFRLQVLRDAMLQAAEKASERLKPQMIKQAKRMEHPSGLHGKLAFVLSDCYLRPLMDYCVSQVSEETAETGLSTEAAAANLEDDVVKAISSVAQICRDYVLIGLTAVAEPILARAENLYCATAVSARFPMHDAQAIVLRKHFQSGSSLLGFRFDDLGDFEGYAGSKRRKEFDHQSISGSVLIDDGFVRMNGKPESAELPQSHVFGLNCIRDVSSAIQEAYEIRFFLLRRLRKVYGYSTGRSVGSTSVHGTVFLTDGLGHLGALINTLPVGVRCVLMRCINAPLFWLYRMAQMIVLWCHHLLICAIFEEKLRVSSLKTLSDFLTYELTLWQPGRKGVHAIDHLVGSERKEKISSVARSTSESHLDRDAYHILCSYVYIGVMDTLQRIMRNQWVKSRSSHSVPASEAHMRRLVATYKTVVQTFHGVFMQSSRKAPPILPYPFRALKKRWNRYNSKLLAIPVNDSKPLQDAGDMKLALEKFSFAVPEAYVSSGAAERKGINGFDSASGRTPLPGLDVSGRLLHWPVFGATKASSADNPSLFAYIMSVDDTLSYSVGERRENCTLSMEARALCTVGCDIACSAGESAFFSMESRMSGIVKDAYGAYFRVIEPPRTAYQKIAVENLTRKETIGGRPVYVLRKSLQDIFGGMAETISHQGAQFEKKVRAEWDEMHLSRVMGSSRGLALQSFLKYRHTKGVQRLMTMTPGAVKLNANHRLSVVGDDSKTEWQVGIQRSATEALEGMTQKLENEMDEKEDETSGQQQHAGGGDDSKDGGQKEVPAEDGELPFWLGFSQARIPSASILPSPVDMVTLGSLYVARLFHILYASSTADLISAWDHWLEARRRVHKEVTDGGDSDEPASSDEEEASNSDTSDEKEPVVPARSDLASPSRVGVKLAVNLVAFGVKKVLLYRVLKIRASEDSDSIAKKFMKKHSRPAENL